MSQGKNDPLLNELKAMKQRMETLYSERFGNGEPQAPEPPAEEEMWQPLVDVCETDNEWLILADLPGVEDDELQVEIDGDELILKGKREFRPIGEQTKDIQVERPRGHFSRAFLLPQKVRKSAVKAELKRGVLTITIPKDHSVASPAHKVVIQSD